MITGHHIGQDEGLKGVDGSHEDHEEGRWSQHGKSNVPKAVRPAGPIHDCGLVEMR